MSMRSLALISRRLALAAALLTVPHPATAQWTVPTAEELSMTAQPEVPGAAAVMLFHEEITVDKLHMWSKYVRIKVLTERGKDLGTVELEQFSKTGGGGYTVEDIEGRTIHPDGTIIPFTGKPLEKIVDNSQGLKVTQKVFTLPDVEVGSIIEYRFNLRYDDRWFKSPDWIIQTDLYTRKGHFVWKPTDQQLISSNERGERLTSVIAWTPFLPKGVEVKQSSTPATATSAGQATLELNVHDIAPIPREEYMPPTQSLGYRVLFYYSPYRSAEEYWKSEGKDWAKSRDKFIGPGSKIREAVTGLVAASDTQDQKLRKIYAAIMKVDNTAFDRGHSVTEDKAEGLGEVKYADDVWVRQRGTDDQIAELFVAMARAAGMKAYVMSVTDRNRNLFVASYLSFRQLNDLIAIVNVDNTEKFFDPGQRDCPYGHLAWKHTLTQGVRQAEGGSALARTPSEPYTASVTKRVANLTMDEYGEVTGTVKMTWTGSPALVWRQAALRGDATSLGRDLTHDVELLVPKGMEVKLKAIEQLDDYEQPLVVAFDVKGAVGSPTGKRMLLPLDLFEARAVPLFPHEKRESPVYFHYTHVVQDATRINFPAGFSVESLPKSDGMLFQEAISYNIATESTATSFTSRRNFVLGGLIFPVEEYSGLRDFYARADTKDQETVVLKAPTAAAGN
jgi:hypothetical protein